MPVTKYYIVSGIEGSFPSLAAAQKSKSLPTVYRVWNVNGFHFLRSIMLNGIQLESVRKCDFHIKRDTNNTLKTYDNSTR